nr:MAG TPA: hypothetical protein [Caudoviricetes sp.]
MSWRKFLEEAVSAAKFALVFWQWVVLLVFHTLLVISPVVLIWMIAERLGF